MRVILSFVLIASCMAVSPAPLAAQGGGGNPAPQPPGREPGIPVGEEVKIPTTEYLRGLIRQVEDFVSHWGRTVPDGRLSWAEVHAAIVEATSQDLSMEVRNALKDLLTEIFPGFPERPITAEGVTALLEGIDTDQNGAVRDSELDTFLGRKPSIVGRVVALVEALIRYLEGLVQRLGDLNETLLSILGIDADEASNLKAILEEVLKLLRELLHMLLKPPHVEDVIIGLTRSGINYGAAG